MPPFQPSYPLKALTRVVMIYNVLTCDDASNDTDATVRELVRRLEHGEEKVSKKTVEAALYCCNMNDEDKKFWHPFKRPFRAFVGDVSDGDWWFDEYYNLIRDNDCKKETKNGRTTKARG